jgi:hypothetical protein
MGIYKCNVYQANEIISKEINNLENFQELHFKLELL